MSEAVTVSARSLIALRGAGERLSASRSRISASQSGGYRSPYKGRGMEFEESRRYQAGDDIRNMDWRVTARTGEAYTKLYREERERPVLMDQRMPPRGAAGLAQQSPRGPGRRHPLVRGTPPRAAAEARHARRVEPDQRSV